MLDGSNRRGRSVLDLLRLRQSCRVFAAEPSGTICQRAAEAVKRLNNADSAPQTMRNLVTPGTDATIIALPHDAPWAVPETVDMVRGPKHWAAVVQHAGPVRRNGLAVGVLLERATIALYELGLMSVTIADPRLGAAFPELSHVPKGSSLATMICYGVPDNAVLAKTQRTSRKPWNTLFFDGAWRNPLTKAVTLAKGGTGMLGCLDAVRVGQSAFNTQPWRVVLDRHQCPKGQQKWHFFFETPRSVPDGLDPTSWAGLDMGVAVTNFDAVAREFGIKGKWTGRLNETQERSLMKRLKIPQKNVLHYATWEEGGSQ